ncbi:hypothetical protein ABU162_26320 [Paenibacillus thiaminolyticus]|uniref:hypothetical protein n=1 Tax=Paenibacillus thiaminolyticus TaxID=49283 RepID=UPI0035A6C13D
MRKQKLLNLVATMLAAVMILVFPSSSFADNAYADKNYPHLKLQIGNSKFKKQVQPTVVPVIAGGIALGEYLAGFLAAAVVAALLTYEGAGLVTKVYSDVIKNNSKTKKNYFVASIDYNNAGEIKITEALTWEQAQKYYKAGGDLWTPFEQDARNLAKKVSSNGLVVRENNWKGGSKKLKYFDHYHDEPRKYKHIWFGKDFKWGAQDWEPWSLPIEASMQLENLPLAN